MRREMADYQRGVGQRLKALRQSRQASQETAAHMAGVSTTTWRNWERGLRAPYERNWRKLAEGFELTDVAVAAIRGEPPTPLGLSNNGDGPIEEVLSLLRAVDARLGRLEELLSDLALERLEAETPEQPQTKSRRGGRSSVGGA